MKALILAAGAGSRLGAAAGGLPKPLVDVGGVTPLRRNLAWVAAERPDAIWVNVHGAADLIRAHGGAEVDGVPIHYSYEPQLLGTAGAWRNLASEWDATTLVVYGDNFMHFDLQGLLAAHRDAGRTCTVALFDPRLHANTGAGGGRAELDGTRITAFVEGGATGLINAGVYAIEPDLTRELAGGFLDFGHDVLPWLARNGRLAGHVLEAGAYCLGIDTPERLQLARAMQMHEVLS